jgi:hypothetical protein
MALAGGMQLKVAASAGLPLLLGVVLSIERRDDRDKPGHVFRPPAISSAVITR